jgi:pimeloyl-ACP methyl ester carboxylesterase
MASLKFTLRSGRALGITTHGSPIARHVVVFCHPAPGSGIFDPDPVVTADGDVHVIAIDRPGYGSSDPLPDGQWPTVIGAANDISEYLLQAEGAAGAFQPSAFESVSVVGWSAGGRVALALATMHPSLIHRVVVIATPAPNEEVEWIPAGYAEASEKLGALPAEDAIEKFTGMFDSLMADQLPAPHSDAPVPLDLLGISGADAPALSGPGVQERLELMMRDALRQGTIGVVTDILSYTARPWGFDLGDVRAQTLLVYGQDDRLVTADHAAWYRRNLPDATVELVPGVGHLVVVPAWKRVLEHLVGE